MIMALCENCDTRLTGEEHFCPGCGNSISSEVGSNQSEQEQIEAEVDAPEEVGPKPWLIISLIIAAVVIIGMSLPWIYGLDLGSRGVGLVAIRGWDMGSLVIIANLTALGLCIKLGSMPVETNKIKPAGALLAVSIILLVLAFYLAMTIGEYAFGAVIPLKDTPEYGFWIALSGYIGFIILSIAAIFKDVKAT